MPFIDIKYIDLKITDGKLPAKRRVEFWRRSTKTLLLMIPAADVPNDGIVYTEVLDPTIPPQDIYALIFDDVGKRQMAGVDKMFIKTKQVWSEQALIFHAEFNPGETTNERVSGAPLMVSGKSTEQDYLNGVLTTFTGITPVITEFGLFSHAAAINYCRNLYEPVSFTTVDTSQTYKSLPLMRIRETVDNGIHTAKNVLSFIPHSVDSLMPKPITVSRYISAVGGTTKFTLYYYGTGSVLLFGVLVDLSTLSVSLVSLAELSYNTNTPPIARLRIDPTYPDFYLLTVALYIPANIALIEEIVTLKSPTNESSYAGVTSRGLDLCRPNDTDGRTVGRLPILNVSTVARAINTTSDAAIYYDGTRLNRTFIDKLAHNINDTDGKSLRMEAKFTINVSKFDFINAAIVGGAFNSIFKFTADGGMEIPLKADFKANSIVRSLDDYKIGDTFEIKICVDDYEKVPAAVKTKYNLLSADYPTNAMVAQIQIKNLNGTTSIVHESSIGILNDVSVVFKLASQPKHGIYLKYFKVWDQPLAGDWIV